MLRFLSPARNDITMHFSFYVKKGISGITGQSLKVTPKIAHHSEPGPVLDESEIILSLTLVGMTFKRKKNAHI